MAPVRAAGMATLTPASGCFFAASSTRPSILPVVPAMAPAGSSAASSTASHADLSTPRRSRETMNPRTSLRPPGPNSNGADRVDPRRPCRVAVLRLRRRSGRRLFQEHDLSGQVGPRGAAARIPDPQPHHVDPGAEPLAAQDRIVNPGGLDPQPAL